ncbi:MAG TPA: hypothetical protein VI072_30965 [Polyangiaceae bacterium]
MLRSHQTMLRALVRIGSKRAADVCIDDHGDDWLWVKITFASP